MNKTKYVSIKTDDEDFFKAWTLKQAIESLTKSSAPNDSSHIKYRMFLFSEIFRQRVDLEDEGAVERIPKYTLSREFLNSKWPNYYYTDKDLKQIDFIIKSWAGVITSLPFIIDGFNGRNE